MGDFIAMQLVRHDLPRFAAITSQQALEKPLCSSTITLGLEVHIDYLAILTFPVKISSLVSTEYEASVDYASLALLRQDSR